MCPRAGLGKQEFWLQRPRASPHPPSPPTGGGLLPSIPSPSTPLIQTHELSKDGNRCGSSELVAESSHGTYWVWKNGALGSSGFFGAGLLVRDLLRWTAGVYWALMHSVP